jgi:putative membrane protein
MKLLIRWAITSFALYVAAWIVPGIRVEENGWVAFGVMAIILGLVNAIVRPMLKLLSCPLIIVTLGLFVLVINGITLWLAKSRATKCDQIRPETRFSRKPQCFRGSVFAAERLSLI